MAAAVSTVVVVVVVVFIVSGSGDALYCLLVVYQACLLACMLK